MARSRDVKTHESTGAESPGVKSSGKHTGVNSGGDQDTARSANADVASMSDQAAEVLGQVQHQAASIIGMANQQASTQLVAQQERAAATLGSVATALHEAGKQLRQQEDAAPLAGYVDAAADRVEQLSTMLREQDINQIIDATAQFARRQPVVFLAGAFALGFLGTRFLKSSTPSTGRSSGNVSYGDSNSGYTWPGAQGGYGYSGAGQSGGMRASSAVESSRQDRLTGSAGAGAASDWSSPHSAAPGAEGS
jgi:hypothetical protein